MRPWHVISGKIISASMLFLLCSSASYGQSVAGGSARLALKGYDPVAYFTESRPVKGAPELTHDWDGARYQFSSAKHRETFVANPDRYAPQYGGFCTGGMSRGKKTEADPELWKIVDGKLYVFASPRAKEGLEKDPPGTIERGRQHWKRLK